MMHCFSVDVEGFCEGRMGCIPMSAGMVRGKMDKEETEYNVDRILDFLSSHKVKGTFYILGIIAKEQPSLVRRIADEGHEVASHSYEHVHLFDVDYEKTRKMISDSKKLIEDTINRRIYGFRAPFFSINKEISYLPDLIRESGFEYDSTISDVSQAGPCEENDRGRSIFRLKNGLVEFPPSVYRFAGRAIPALGGGYFRLYPISVSRLFIKGLQGRNHSAMCYIHPYEIGNRYPYLDHLSMTKKFRYYFNVENTKEKFKRLFTEFAFGRAVDILKSRGLIA